MSSTGKPAPAPGTETQGAKGPEVTEEKPQIAVPVPDENKPLSGGRRNKRRNHKRRTLRKKRGSRRK